MSLVVRIAIDAMGGDLGPQPILAAAQKFILAYPNTHITLVGDESVLAQHLAAKNIPNLSIIHASDTVRMEDKPSVVLRHKQQSSMWKTVELVRDNKVDACVSCGNTGALMAMGKYLLKTYPGIDRPAICKAIPSINGHCYLLDLGANINCTAEQLVQFAFMGSVLANVSDGISSPKVGLLNIGEENIKGIEQVKVASEILRENSQINYSGFVEGDDIFTGEVDVVVCDGFVGNIALKVSEGTAKFLAQNVQKAFKNKWYGRMLGFLANPVVNQFRAKYDPARYNGASFLGLQGTVIKSHGGANERGFYYALKMAVTHVENQIPEKINAQFETLFL